MDSEKIAVIFPGIGYNNDKPLLYYAAKIVKEMGYEIIKISYDFPYKAGDVKGKKDKMVDAFELAASQAKEQLSEIDFGNYREVLFIGKSIGTAVAGYCNRELDADAVQIVLTPVPETFKFLEGVKGIVFHGTADPWCETKVADSYCRELALPFAMVPGANHSLETGDAIEDIKNLGIITDRIKTFVGGLHNAF